MIAMGYGHGNEEESFKNLKVATLGIRTKLYGRDRTVWFLDAKTFERPDM